ncbi:50S ribosomal protein L13, partial [bacterium]|nr:50S ribosomal protein L13 [bacterium]
MSKTPYFTKERVERPWYVVDAADRVLGRLATGVAKLLIGKYRPEYTPGQDCGAFVVVVNAGRIAVTGKKKLQKKYYRHSGYPGGLRELTFNQQMERKPTEALRLAIKGMLPKNKLGARLITKLKM